jgi:hypothetical protein
LVSDDSVLSHVYLMMPVADGVSVVRSPTAAERPG